MVTQPTLGIVRKHIALENRFSKEILKRYRLMGSAFYQGVSFTYLKVGKGVNREVIEKHPVYIAMQLMLRKLYLEHQTTILINQRLHQTLVNRQLESVMKLIGREYREIYVYLRDLKTMIERPGSERMKADAQTLLSVQMKRMQGNPMFSEEERLFLGRFSEYGGGKIQFAGVSSPEVDRVEISEKEMPFQEKMVQPQESTVWTKDLTADAVGDETRPLRNELRHPDDGLLQGRRELIYHLTRDAGQEEKEAFAAYLQREKLEIENLQDFTDVQMERVYEILTNIPKIWKEYEAQREKMASNGDVDEEEKLLLFLNIFQEGTQEERTAFREYLRSHEAALLRNTVYQPGELLTFLERDPAKMIELLEKQQSQSELGQLWKKVQSGESFRRVGFPDGGLAPEELSRLQGLTVRQEGLTVGAAGNEIPLLGNELQHQENELLQGRWELIYRLTQEAGQEEKEAFAAYLQREKLEIENLQDFTDVQMERVYEILTNVPRIWKEYEVQREKMASSGDVDEEEKLLLFLNIFQEGTQEERTAFREYLRSHEAVLLRNTDYQPEALLTFLERDPSRMIELLEKQQSQSEIGQLWKRVQSGENFRGMGFPDGGLAPAESFRLQGLTVRPEGLATGAVGDETRSLRNELRHQENELLQGRRELIYRLIQGAGQEEKEGFAAYPQRERFEIENLQNVTDSQRERIYRLFHFFSGQKWEKILSRYQNIMGATTVTTLNQALRSAYGRPESSIQMSLQGYRETEAVRNGLLVYMKLRSEKERRMFAKEALKEFSQKEIRMRQNAEQKGEGLEKEAGAALERIDENTIVTIIKNANRGELERIVQRLTEYSSTEDSEQSFFSENGSRAWREGLAERWKMPGYPLLQGEILERPYHFVYQKRRLMEAVRVGNEPELMTLFTYMRGNRMLAQNERAGDFGVLRNLLHRRIRSLSMEQVSELSENVLQYVLEMQQIRRTDRYLTELHPEVKARRTMHIDRDGQNLTELEMRALEKVGILEGVSPINHNVNDVSGNGVMVHRDMENREVEQNEIREIIERYVVEEKKETGQLRHKQESTVQLLSQQQEELAQIRKKLKEQSEVVEELKISKANYQLNRNELYREMMDRMEKKLHLERLRRGLD